MSTREDVIKKKLALQDSIRAEGNPKKKKAMEKRFKKMRIPTSSEMDKTRTDSINKKLKMPNAAESIRRRQAVIDSLKKVKS